MRAQRWSAVAGAVWVLSACGGDDDPWAVGSRNTRPSYLVGTPSALRYDGNSNDLLTAGLGKTGLAAASAPAYADPLAPTAAELRRNAIHTNYRALVDTTAGGGYGSLYGPNVALDGTVGTGEGLVPGREHIAYADDGSGRQNVTLMVQVPDSFNPAQACIVTATSSGSRGVYGAIGTAGEWGLKRGCAVAYTDKGTGNGQFDLARNLAALIDGTLADAATAGVRSLFTPALSEAERNGFNTAFPNRVAYKHAHSQQNPEKDWGRDTLRAIDFAFWVLNEQHGQALGNGVTLRTIVPSNTLVLASSVSNGAGAAIAAAEQDRQGLIDGVVASEPQVQAASTGGLVLKQGATTQTSVGKPLLDYFTHANLYQPCAALATPGAPAAAFLSAALSTNRCTALHAKGLLTGADTTAQAADALARLRAYGWLADSDALHSSHYRFATNAIVVTYANAHGRFSVADNLCGYSLANSNATGDVVAQTGAGFAGLFASGNGVPPTTGVNLIYNDAVGGPKQELFAVSPSSGLADIALDGALCMRALATGRDPVTGAALGGALAAQSQRVREGMAQVQLQANIPSKPVIVLAGRNDALIPVNHAARAYTGAQWVRHGVGQFRYLEVTNAQHFDAFNGSAAFAGYDSRYIPLHHYFNEAMNRMYAHLRHGAPLPDSQVVRTTPRGGTPGAAPAIGSANVPPIASTAAPSDRIAFDSASRTMTVPD